MKKNALKFMAVASALVISSVAPMVASAATTFASCSHTNTSFTAYNSYYTFLSGDTHLYHEDGYYHCNDCNADYAGSRDIEEPHSYTYNYSV